MYTEWIAIHCRSKTTMPLGVDGDHRFRVYPGTRMHEALRDGDILLLLQPRDPILYAESVFHRLEHRLDWATGCPPAGRPEGLWYACRASYTGVDEHGARWYTCRWMRRLAGEPPAYTRPYGCLVEALVAYTKLRAGIPVPGGRGYIEGLKWCVERGSRGDRRLLASMHEVLQRIQEVLGEG